MATLPKSEPTTSTIPNKKWNFIMEEQGSNTSQQ